jgi:hypothetical protein
MQSSTDLALQTKCHQHGYVFKFWLLQGKTLLLLDELVLDLFIMLHSQRTISSLALRKQAKTGRLQSANEWYAIGIEFFTYSYLFSMLTITYRGSLTNF